ncbi:BZ3500_MvSof-1268-A1-R1_Chr9g10397 [Microbotryum saponariae]|uniref:BZ3500_MvSof-1268-A1-R1_Chr9g10397 protein n=1 Tax=Microbotryum saponariae TaxID=289078 RepID=A0A2X0L0I8_9BASI|nr:BZ3501_MvSof-1269-A2-R1_Chr9g10147 [Microbotryum saponariae]SDA00024.1 BZ3500_MvSof-1268-A1-R1_Chr9g10397 [Microbotryum saponariae]
MVPKPFIENDCTPIRNTQPLPHRLIGSDLPAISGDIAKQTAEAIDGMGMLIFAQNVDRSLSVLFIFSHNVDRFLEAVILSPMLELANRVSTRTLH